MVRSKYSILLSKIKSYYHFISDFKLLHEQIDSQISLFEKNGNVEAQMVFIIPIFICIRDSLVHIPLNVDHKSIHKNCATFLSFGLKKNLDQATKYGTVWFLMSCILLQYKILKTIVRFRKKKGKLGWKWRGIFDFGIMGQSIINNTFFRDVGVKATRIWE